MANIVVLGSEGQIGKPLVAYLESQGHDVTGIDLVNGPEHDLRYTRDGGGLSFFVERALDVADFVYFLAFDVGGSKYLKQYEKSYQFIWNNIQIMQNVFNELNITKTPFIFASSQMSNMSYSTYGQLKAIGESYTKALGGLSVKFWNVYGYEEDEEKAHVITDFIRMALEDEEIRMMTDGTEVRQFMHTSDCVKTLDELRQEYEKFVGVDRDLCITNFYWTSIATIAEHVSELTGAKVIVGESRDIVQRDRHNEPDPYLWTYLKHYSLSVTPFEGIRIVMEQMLEARKGE